ncbi:MAG TPA: prolyl oligopeptidase family serine peptidase, partial [Abditibacterium sp.]
NEGHQVFFHRVGTTQKEDALVYQDLDPNNAQRFHTASTTDDERFVVLSLSDRGKGKDGNLIMVREAKSLDAKFTLLSDSSFEWKHNVVGVVGDRLLVETNKGAPNKKVVLIDPRNPAEANWKTIRPEGEEPLISVSQVGGKLIAVSMKDVTHRVRVYDETGRFENEIALPALGTVSGFGGERDDSETFYTFTSYAHPPTIYRYDVATKTSTIFRRPEIQINPADYETQQVFFPSKDGTRVPMFIVSKKGLALNRQNPTLLYAYGGFNIALNPGFSALNLAWLEQGGVYAVANLRGGSEYGEKWHQAGMKEKKQTVFDDFIAAAEFLKSSGYTSTEKLAIQGGSNGGLLVGAVMTQRPDLCRVALPAVGVMDMLRYHKFTIGYNWAAEYGSADESEASFKNLLSYSPLHNLKPGVNYPATLITTADHDDRVVPAHSFKFAATLQAMGSPNPALIRVETKSGHGASSTTKQLDTTADVFAFLMQNLGMTPKF